MASLSDITVPCPILRNPAPTIRGGPDGRSGEIYFHIALNDLAEFLRVAAGTRETITLPGGITMERILPLVHPDDPEMLLLGYDGEAMGTPGGTGASIHSPQFSHYRVRCDFATLPWGVGGDQPYYTLSTETGEGFETIPNATLKFPDGSPVTGEYGLPMSSTVLNLTTYLNPDPVTYALAAMTGKINSVVFDGFPIGTLRFTGVRSEAAVGMFSRSLVKSYGFKFRDRPWNQVMKTNGTWDTPTLGTTGLTKYASVDLNALKTM